MAGRRRDHATTGRVAIRVASPVAVALAVVAAPAVSGAAGLKGAVSGDGTSPEGSVVAAAANPHLGDPRMVAEGKRLYARLCMICHRKTGGRGPNLRKTRLTDGVFLKIVLEGRKGNRGTMPAWRNRLTADEVWKIHAYVKDGVK